MKNFIEMILLWLTILLALSIGTFVTFEVLTSVQNQGDLIE